MSFKLKAQSEENRKLYLPIIDHIYYVSSLLESKVPGIPFKVLGPKWCLAHSSAFERPGDAVTIITSPKPFFFIL